MLAGMGVTLDMYTYQMGFPCIVSHDEKGARKKDPEVD
jgi:hypothetical protein